MAEFSITSSGASIFTQDKAKRQAAEVLMHLLEHQQLQSVHLSDGAAAASFCADFIEALAPRLEKASKP